MPEMRQLPDGTWLDEETGVVVAPEQFASRSGQNNVYTGPPLVPNPNIGNPTPPLPPQKQGILPRAHFHANAGQWPGPHLAVDPYGMGQAPEMAKKALLLVGFVTVVSGTVWLSNKLKGKKKKA